jgi:hypothetical protein
VLCEIQSERAASVFEFHPTHNHWYTADAARFEVRVGSATGAIAGGNRKVTVTGHSSCASPGLCGEGAPNPG